MIILSFTFQDTMVVVEVVFGREHLVTGYLDIGVVDLEDSIITDG